MSQPFKFELSVEGKQALEALTSTVTSIGNVMAEACNQFGERLSQVQFNLPKEILAARDKDERYGPPIVVGTSWSAPDADPIADIQAMYEQWGVPMPKVPTGNPFLDANRHLFEIEAHGNWAGTDWQAQLSYCDPSGYIGCGACEDVWCFHLEHAFENPHFDAGYIDLLISTDQLPWEWRKIMVPAFVEDRSQAVGFVQVMCGSWINDKSQVQVMRQLLGETNALFEEPASDAFVAGDLLKGIEGMTSLIGMVENYIKGWVERGEFKCGSGSHWRSGKSDPTITTYEDAVYWLAHGKCKFCVDFGQYARAKAGPLAPTYETKWRT